MLEHAKWDYQVWIWRMQKLIDIMDFKTARERSKKTAYLNYLKITTFLLARADKRE